MEMVTMEESCPTALQTAVTVLTCAYCRISFTAYHDLRCHIISTHKLVKIPPAEAPTSIIDSSSPIEDEIHPKSPKIKQTDRGLRAHKRIRRAAVTSQIQCENCGIEFPSLQLLQSHREIHPPPIPASPAAAAAIEQQGGAGIGYSESAKPLRRSSRLLAKSSITMSQSTEMAPSSKRPKPKRLQFNPYQRGDFFVSGGYSEIPKFLQRQRKSTGNYFRCAYAYKDACADGWDKIFEKRFIVVSGGENIHQQHVLPYEVDGYHGITWIGVYGINSVHGINSICAVYLNQKPDRQCIVNWLKNRSPLSSYFTAYVLSKMEDVADSPPYLEKILKEPTDGSSPYSQKTLKPFAVVSLPGSSNVDKKSCPEVSTPSLKAQGETIAHLKNELMSHSAYSMFQIQQIAISAFQRLWEKEFKAEDVTVCCFREDIDGRDYKLGNLSCARVKRVLETINQSVENQIEDQV